MKVKEKGYKKKKSLRKANVVIPCTCSQHGGSHVSSTTWIFIITKTMNINSRMQMTCIAVKSNRTRVDRPIRIRIDYHNLCIY